MKNQKQIMALLLAFATLFTACAPQQTEKTPEGSQSVSLATAQKAYLEKVDVDYSYDLAVKLSEIRSNEALGYRTAGSPAEIATGDLLKAEMEKIGLQNVTKDAFTLDTWNFETAQLSYTTAEGLEKKIELGGYQTNFNTDGPKEYPIVYAGQGTEAELAELDVEGKLVLIDINQRDNWWVNYPAYEGKLHGAVAVLAAQDGGYSEISPDALNAQDICGPADAHILSISRTDADLLLGELEKDNTIKVSLNVKSTVVMDGTSYNITGVIPGKDPDSMVLMSAHYDSYFEGFQDDNAAISLMFGIAKAIVESGYQPEKTLVFCALAAEEWGVSNTRYDWSTGAYNQIFRIHPEWVGKIVANLNFELPAMAEGDTDQIRTAYELKTFTEAFAAKIPAVEGIFTKGLEVITPTYTWSDDFSFSIAGVPANVTALRGGFSQSHYHTQFDNKDTYSREAFLYHHNLYGMLLQEYDRCAVSPLNFTTRLEALTASIDPQVMGAEELAALTKAIETATPAASAAYGKVESLNTDYRTALDAGDMAKAAATYTSAKPVNTAVLTAFKSAEDSLVRLTWEDVPIFPHEHAQNNLKALNGAIAALEKGDVASALDEYLYQVDNNWYAYDWSRDTYDYFTSYVLDQPADRLMWGAGRVQGHEDLFDVINSLQAKLIAVDTDVSAELGTLRVVADRQTELLKVQVADEVAALTQLTQQLETIAK